MSEMLKMRPFLLSLPEKLQMVIIVVGTMTSAFAAAIAIRALFGINQLVGNTELTIAVYGILGTIYGILLAFVISGIWENHKAAQASVLAESAALMGIGYILGASPTEQTKEIRSRALAYAKVVVDEWDALGGVVRGEVPPWISVTMPRLHCYTRFNPSSPRTIGKP
jgi:uncharacterized membrane protein YccC